MPSQAEMKHLNKMAKIIRTSNGITKDELILSSDISIAWAEKLCKYIPILFQDIKFDSKHRQYVLLSTLSTLEQELEK